MFETRLTTTSSEGLRALGQKEQRSYELISAVVGERLGQAHANIFAESVPTRHGDQYDWYAATAGKAGKLSDLTEDKQAQARKALKQLTDDISIEAERLIASKDVSDIRLGEALQNAIRVPGDDYIYVIETPDGIKPVLVNWAWTSDEQAVVRGVLTGQDARVSSAPPAKKLPPLGTAPVPENRAEKTVVTTSETQSRGLAWLWWVIGLGWLLLAAMLLAILLLLVRPCGLNGFLGLNFCPVQVVTVDAFDDTAGLANQLAALERELAALDRSCQPPVTPIDPPVSPVQDPIEEPVAEPPVDDLAERMERSGAQRGDLTFTLSWDTTSDLDLWVTCPAGSIISYSNRESCGGFLDVDSNAGQLRQDPIENTYFNAPSVGSYYVRVNLYSLRSSNGPQHFRLTIQDGEHYEQHDGTVSTDRPDWSVAYAYRGENGTRAE